MELLLRSADEVLASQLPGIKAQVRRELGELQGSCTKLLEMSKKLDKGVGISDEVYKLAEEVIARSRLTHNKLHQMT